MAARTRTVRLDLSSTLYEPLEHYAALRDVGVPDLIRYLIVEWSHQHPLPDDEADT